MKKISSLLLLLASCFALESSAQKVFYGAGFLVGRTHTVPMTFSGFGNPVKQSKPVYMYGAGVCLDAQLFPLSDEMSVGFHVEPGLGYVLPFTEGVDDVALILQTPLIAQFNYGNYSSINSTKEVGFGVGLGALTQYHFLLDEPPTNRGKSFLFLPAVQASVRFWGRSNSLYVVRLTHAVGTEMHGGFENNRGTSFLSVSRIINY